MDFMKVFDQTVREIKREVNLKVLKVPEIEQKVLDATEDEPWGPHGTVLAEIARATKKISECQIVMNVLWTRLYETGKNWRFVYKSLAVIEYLVAHGAERAVDDIIEHTFQISSLASFEYVEPNGKDLGINVRKKAETIVALLNNKDKIQEVRGKAAENREKYVGLSSSGITYKSGAASFGSSSLNNRDRYGGFGNMGDSETFTDRFNDNDRSGEDKYVKTNKSKKASQVGSKGNDSIATSGSKTKEKYNQDKYASVTSENKMSDKYDEDFDDFDPRGTSEPKTSAASKQVDLFGGNLVDLLDDPVSIPTDDSISFNKDTSEVDLFADAAFVSAPPQVETVKISAPQGNVDLFASHGAPSSMVDLFASPNSVDNNDTKPDTTNNIVDPFASLPLNNFDGSDPFGAFTSHTDPLSNQNSSTNQIDINLTPGETKAPAKKEAFQVKSGIWAESLTRGLIDLNITAPKKVDLAGVGVVGGLGDGSEDKGHMPSFYMGTAMGMGSGATGKSSGFTSATSLNDDDFFSSLSTGSNSQNYQFGGFQK